VSSASISVESSSTITIPFSLTTSNRLCRICFRMLFNFSSNEFPQKFLAIFDGPFVRWTRLSIGTHSDDPSAQEMVDTLLSFLGWFLFTNSMEDIILGMSGKFRTNARPNALLRPSMTPMHTPLPISVSMSTFV